MARDAVSLRGDGIVATTSLVSRIRRDLVWGKKDFVFSNVLDLEGQVDSAQVQDPCELSGIGSGKSV